MTNAVSLAQQASTGVSPGFRNRIINGAMTIDQRNDGASVTIGAGAVYTLDRYQAFGDQASKFSVQQNAGSVTPPTGFTNYLGVTSLSAYTLATDDRFFVRHKIEGFNTADLDFGKATAKTITLSFWVRSSLTGTFGGSIQNGNGDRSYPFTFTISAANTWEYETITIVGDTSGTWLTTNGIGLVVNFGLGVQGSTYAGTAGAWNSNNNYSATGATSVVGTNGATFYITGVQLEVGSTATSFDARPYQTELNLCYRYYWVLAKGDTAAIGNGCYHGTTQVRSYIPFPVTMRVDPSLISNSGSSYYQMELGGGGSDQFNSFTIYRSAVNGAIIYNSTEVSGTSAAAGTLNGNNASAFVSFTAEL